jgi:hypothetical protein
VNAVSAHQAIAVCRARCWKYDWVIDLDVQKFFDEVPWGLVMKAVKAVTDCRWALLYVERRDGTSGTQRELEQRACARTQKPERMLSYAGEYGSWPSSRPG